MLCLVIFCGWYPGLLAGLGILYYMDGCIVVWTFKNSMMFCLNERIIIWDMQSYIPYVLWGFLSVLFLQLQLPWCCVSFPVLKCLCVCFIFFLESLSWNFCPLTQSPNIQVTRVGLIFARDKANFSLKSLLASFRYWRISAFLGRLLTSYC